MSTSSFTDDADQPDSHYQLLKNAIPTWLGSASSVKRQALSKATPRPLPITAEFKRLNAAHWEAQNAVDSALKQLQGPRAFARAMLEEALLTRYGVDLNSETIYLRLYIPQHVPWFSIPSGAARTWTVSLLDAALHNFEHGETVAGAYEADSTFISQPDANGQFDTQPAILEKISITDFTGLCRELDIGAHYQTYLRTQLGLTEPVSAAVLQANVDASHKAALRSALHLARLRGDIQPDYAQQIENLLQGRSALTLGNLPLHCHRLQMMDAPLTGILLFAPDLETTRSVQRLVAWVPDDPQHPLKEYPSALAFKQELTRQLRDADYQAFFSRFVAHAQRGLFFANLSQRLGRITWHPTEYGSGLAPWRREPTDDPKLQFVATAVQGDVWRHLYQQKLNRILNDARTQAVSTATVDRNARWALWDSAVNVASSILNAVLLIVAPFVPMFGELMLGYMAWQLLDDVFEGVVDWAEGLPKEAFGHLMSVLQALVQLGAFGVGTTIGVAQLRKVLPAEVIAFIDRFKPVTLASGAKRYWKQDLASYQQKMRLPPRLGVNAMGLHQVRAETILPLENQLYAVRALADGKRHVIKHPTRADAYTPSLQHNGAGAWHTELEAPAQWDRATLLRRLGHGVESLNEGDRDLALRLSGVNENALRQMHVRGDPVPPLLDDTLARLSIDRNLQRLIDRLDSDDPAQHAQVDPQDELQLLTTYGDWPKTRSLRILDATGNTAWEYGDKRMPVVQIHEAQLANGELLKTLLQALSPEEIHEQFGERAADPELSLDNRIKQLRKKLARQARTHRRALFDSRYAQRQVTTDAHAQHLMQTAPDLPASVTTQLLAQASGRELQALDNRSTPPRLADMARSVLDELRVNRAYEGQHLEAVHNLDTDRLALNTLKLLPGWSAQVRLEATHLSPKGSVWLQIGPEDAPVRRTLVRTASDRYVPHDEKGALFGETDLYTAILNALPDAQREALGIDITQGAELKQRLRHSPLARDELRTALMIEPREPARETLRLLGSDTGYPVRPASANRQPTLHERATRLYPALNEYQIQDLLTHLRTLPGGPANALDALAAEYAQLLTDLEAWEQQIPTQHPRTGNPLSAAQQRGERRDRRLIASTLRRCWRRESMIDHYYGDPARDGHTLRLDSPTLGALPVLTANFDHVSLLTLAGSTDTTGVNAFLGRFRQLRHLRVDGFDLGSPPVEIYPMPRLVTLDLSNCNIALTPTSQAQIAALSRLRNLVLFGNPLGRVPSVRGMPALTHIDLSQTGITQLPDGLLSRPELRLGLFSGNQLRELPDELFERPANQPDEFDFSDNPLSAETIKQVKAYFQRYDTYWEIDAPQGDIRDAQALYPSLNQDELNRLVYSLPGSLEAGRIELARLAGELQTLQEQLAHWEHAPGLGAQEFARRIALRNLLEKSWRREPAVRGEPVHALTITSNLAGELPTLSATFRHIRALKLEGTGQAIELSGLLERLPGLRILNVGNVVLGDIPPKVFDVANLWVLTLRNCSITLSASSRAALERMTPLQHLNLNGNPLGVCPDFTQLPGLNAIFLEDAGLDSVPTSLLAPIQRQFINLRANRIEQLPPALFALPDSVSQAFDLSGNPLSQQALEQIKSYHQRTQEHFKAQVPAAQRNWAKRLYPKMGDTAADSFVFGLPGRMADVDAALSGLETDYEHLTTDLQEWATHVPRLHPVLGVALDIGTRAQEQINRLNFKRLVEEAWRRESALDEESLDDHPTHSLVIDTPIMGALPELRGSFEHVTTVEFNGEATTTQVDQFLRGFAHVQTLRLSGCSLGGLPAALFELPSLTTLELRRCAITLTPTTAQSTSDLQSLEFLELSDNPLGHAPDVSHLQALTSLHLRNTRLSQLPNGVFQLANLQNLDVSRNLIHELAPDLLDMLQNFHEDSDLSANPWSTQSLEYLREYYRRTGIDFQITEVTLDAQGNPLQPPLEEPMDEE
ncbi:dermonecrotic toxin domain-containing protein [Pseudomonas sp. LF245]